MLWLASYGRKPEIDAGREAGQFALFMDRKTPKYANKEDGAEY